LVLFFKKEPLAGLFAKLVSSVVVPVEYCSEPDYE